MNVDDRKIERCIKCPIANEVINNYFLFYSHYLIPDRDDEYIESSINQISDTLGILGTPEQKLEYIDIIGNPQMTQATVYKEIHNLTKNKDCVENIHNIIFPIKAFFQDKEQFLVEDFSNNFSKQCIKVLYMIQSFLYKYKHELPDDNPKAEINNMYKECKNAIDSKNKKKIREIYREHNNTLRDYCIRFAGQIEFEYCKPSYTQYSNLKNCQSEMFLDYLKIIKPSKISDNDLYNRINKLKEAYKTKLIEYLFKAPKNAGNILTYVIDYQDLTEQEIANVWNEVNDTKKDDTKEKTADTIKKLKKAKTNKISDSELEVLAKILLVSKDVLECGNGKIYGSFGTALTPLRNDVYEEKQKERYILELQEKYHTKSKTKLRKEVINRIAEMIKSDDENFYQEMKKHKDIFCEEDFCVFTCEDEDTHDICYDFGAMYENLLKPEIFDTLLTVLEELQAQEQE